MPDRRFAIEIPAEPRYLSAVRGFLTGILREPCAELADSLVLAVDECCTNVIKHRCASVASGDIKLTVELGESRVVFKLRTFCTADDVPEIKPRDLADVRPGGLGTHFVGQIMDRVAFEPDPTQAGTMCLVLERDLRRPEDA